MSPGAGAPSHLICCTEPDRESNWLKKEIPTGQRARFHFSSPFRAKAFILATQGKPSIASVKRPALRIPTNNADSSPARTMEG